MKNESSKPETSKIEKIGNSNEVEKPKKRIDYVLDFYQASIPFLVALLWPLTIILIVSIFREPLFDTLQQLPQVVSNSSAIEIAGVSIKVDERIAKINDPELKAALSNLSPTALKLLVSIGNTTGHHARSTSFSEQDMNALQELRDRDLIFLDTNYKFSDNSNPDLDVYYGQTDLGKKAFSFIIDVMFDQLLAATPEK